MIEACERRILEFPLYMAAKKWDMAAAIATHLVNVEPENEACGSI